jgi:hypothetical protein
MKLHQKYKLLIIMSCNRKELINKKRLIKEDSKRDFIEKKLVARVLLAVTRVLEEPEK